MDVCITAYYYTDAMPLDTDFTVQLQHEAYKTGKISQKNYWHTRTAPHPLKDATKLRINVFAGYH